MTNEKFADLMFRAGFLPDNETGRFEGNTIFGTTHDTALRNLVELVAEDCVELLDHTSEKYRQHQKNSVDFAAKNMYSGFASACETVAEMIEKKYNLKD